MSVLFCHLFFFFNDTATTEIYTLSLHDALPIFVADFLYVQLSRVCCGPLNFITRTPAELTYASPAVLGLDRKSTRLNSSHANISYAVFCLKKKKNNKQQPVHVSDTDYHVHTDRT